MQQQESRPGQRLLNAQTERTKLLAHGLNRKPPVYRFGIVARVTPLGANYILVRAQMQTNSTVERKTFIVQSISLLQSILLAHLLGSWSLHTHAHLCRGGIF